jgi:glycosyltransferase involved in cell wall biosynthesis
VKRPDVLLEVADRLPGVAFHMVGGTVPGELQCFESTRADAAKRGNVKFHGAVPYRNVGGFYARARVFVNTSDVEGFPNTYLQAWMSGTPVVAFFDPDDVIARHGLGVVVRTPEQMADAIRMLVQDDAAWEAARARCVSFIEREFAEDRILESYRRLIEAR